MGKNDLGDRLIEVRNDQGIKSSRQFAIKLGADVSYYAKAEKGYGLSDEYLNKIIENYGYNKSWLFFGEGEKFGHNTPNRSTLAQSGTESQDLHTLIQSNATQSEALKVVVDTNALLATMLKNQMSGKASTGSELEDILSGMSATMQGVADSLAEIGAGKRFPSKEAAADAIHKHVSAQHRKRLPKGTLHTSGK